MFRTQLIKMAESGSPVSRSLIKWQLALAVGLPVAVGVGYWFLNGRSKKEKMIKLDERDKTKTREISIDGDTSTKDVEEPHEKTPLELATALKEEGNRLFKNSNYEEAILAYDKAIDVCPKSETISLATFYQNKAAAYEQLQQYKEAKEACSKALSLNPKYTKALIRRAKACENTMDLSQALEDVIAACILENFQSQSTLLSADRILNNLGRQHAKEAMATRVPVIPSASFVRTYFSSFANDPLNSFLENTHEGDTSKGFLKAVECFKRDDFDSIIGACTEEINLTEAEALYKNEALILRATFYQLTGENDLARADLDIVINNDEASPKLRANALIKRATAYMQLEDAQSCINDFNAAILVDQDNSDIYHHRGRVYLLMEKVKEASNDFQLAVSLNPNNPNTLAQKCFTEYRMALFMKNQDTMNEMMKKFEDIIKEYPNCTECYTLYAQVLNDQQEFERADKLFQKAIKIDPTNAILLVRRALLVLQWTGNVETAIKYINEALAVDDKCEFAYETLGTIEVQRGNLVKAIEMFDKAIPLTKTELGMTHIFSLKDAALAQKTVVEKMNIRLPTDLFSS